MINKPSVKGLNVRIPTIIPTKGRGFINQEFWLCINDVCSGAGHGPRFR